MRKPAFRLCKIQRPRSAVQIAQADHCFVFHFLDSMMSSFLMQLFDV